MAGFVQEFKEFALRGNVVDLAVGLVIGAAFGAIVNSLVNDIIMPPIGLVMGNVDFSDLFTNLSGQEKQYIDMVLHATRGDKTVAAKVLGVDAGRLG